MNLPPLVPRTFRQYRNDHVVVTPSHVAPLYMNTRVPAVRTAMARQAGSTWPTIPWRAESSWNGWRQCARGLEYGPAISSSGPARHARHEWSDLPDTDRDDFYLVGEATYNGINEYSTFATPKVMTGFVRAIKATTGVRL